MSRSSGIRMLCMSTTSRVAAHMAKTVAEGFLLFQRRLTPSGSESSRASSHRSSIESALRTRFSLQRFFRSGSFGHGTSVRGYSDVDYFAVFPNGTLPRASADGLHAVWQALDQRFPLTGVRIDAPAVVVPFGSDPAETTEVVPAWAVRHLPVAVFQIPGLDNGWLNAAPIAHNNFVNRNDERLSNRLKPLIRMVKSWKYGYAVSVSSFYLELAITHYIGNTTGLGYPTALHHVFRCLLLMEVEGLTDL